MSKAKNLPTDLWLSLGDAMRWVLTLTHNSLALLGVGLVLGVSLLVTQPQWRQVGELRLFGWLQERQVELTGMVSDLVASDRATAANPQELPRQQAAVALWLSKKYRVAPEPLSAIVAEAYDLGQRVKLDPTLILAVMATESGFNPFAQSPVGAQGLMQVMTNVHSDKYAHFGGPFAAFDPLANLRVGVRVLQDCIRVAGSIEGGLKAYVGAATLEDDGGYTAKVMGEHARLRLVAQGRNVPLASPVAPTIASPKPAPTDAPAQGVSVALAQ